MIDQLLGKMLPADMPAPMPIGHQQWAQGASTTFIWAADLHA